MSIMCVLVYIGGCLTLCHVAREDGRKVPSSLSASAGLKVPRPLPGGEGDDINS